MTLNPSFIGHSYPPTRPRTISRDEVLRFADAIGDPNPVYREPEAARTAGYADVIAPPTFVAALTQQSFEMLAADPGLGLDYARMVHGKQTFDYRRPLVVGDVVTNALSVTDITVSHGVEFLTVRNDVSTVAGDPVLTSTALLIVRPAGVSA